MHRVQMDRLLDTVPAEIDAAQRARLHVYVDTVRRCERRIQALRGELDRALKEAEEEAAEEAAAANGDAPPEPNSVLAIVTELHTVEQVQPRVDAWLKDYVTALISQHAPVGFSDAEVYGDA